MRDFSKAKSVVKHLLLLPPPPTPPKKSEKKYTKHKLTNNFNTS